MGRNVKLRVGSGSRGWAGDCGRAPRDEIQGENCLFVCRVCIMLSLCFFNANNSIRNLS